MVLGEGVPELLSDPGGGGMVGDGDVEDATSVVREDSEHEQEPERDRRHDEEVGGRDLAHVIREEGPPRL